MSRSLNFGSVNFGRSVAVLSLVAIATVGCSNRNSEDTATTQAPATAAPAVTDAPTATDAPVTTDAPTGPMFGTMASPCGQATDAGVPTIADGQNGGDTIKLGTANDHGYEGAPGTTLEMLDAAKAFAGWCNAQGGVRGLPIEIVDLDGKLFSVPPSMEQACAEVFAMAGGGWVFDDQMYPRFHECGMISFSGYAVSAAASMANGKIQPIPNPANEKPAQWLNWARDTYPEAIKNVALIYGDFLTTKSVADQLAATMKAVGGYDGEPSMITYNPAGEANWTPFAQKLKSDGITFMSFVGTDSNLVLLYKAMREVGYVPEVVLNDANFYSSIMVAEGNAVANEGFLARTMYAPFEEADQFPGMASYLDMMETYNPEGRIAGLGLQATSALLMFVTSANACLDSNNNVLERECVLAQGMKIDSWTGGGLHSETNPAAKTAPKCGLIMGVKDSKWARIYPELGSADDNGGGWHCDENGAVDIEGDFGDVTSGVDPTRPN
jgi:ABC-type branched-subunit amino acid transport system substrate-binding protein